MIPYVVRQGDHLLSIAMRYDFDADTVWNDPSNSALRKRRGGDGSILAPHDVLYIPDVPRKWQTVSVGATNRFKVKIPTVKVSIVVELYDAPLANEPFVVHGIAPEISGTSGADGTVAFDVAVTTQSVSLEFPKSQITIPVLIGHLDPSTDDSGVAQRLGNLGYRTSIEGASQPDDGEAWAVRYKQVQTLIKVELEALAMEEYLGDPVKWVRKLVEQVDNYASILSNRDAGKADPKLGCMLAPAYSGEYQVGDLLYFMHASLALSHQSEQPKLVEFLNAQVGSAADAARTK